MEICWIKLWRLRQNNRILGLLFLIFPMLMFLLSCSPSTDIIKKNKINYSSPVLSIPPPPKSRPLVAIAGFENRSTFATDKLWDTCSQFLFTRMIDVGYFRVVEWNRMKQLFDWDALSTSSLVNSPDSRDKARKILLCEYFVLGAVTYFDVSQRSNVSAISKSKEITTAVRVDLMLQDAQTGEYISASNGQAKIKQVFTKGMLGSWDPQAADTAIDTAINDALHKLIRQYDKRTRRP